MRSRSILGPLDAFVAETSLAVSVSSSISVAGFDSSCSGSWAVFESIKSLGFARHWKGLYRNWECNETLWGIEQEVEGNFAMRKLQRGVEISVFMLVSYCFNPKTSLEIQQTQRGGERD